MLNSFAPHYINYLVYAIFAFLSNYIVGFLVFPLLGFKIEKSISSLFLKQTIGLVFTITIFALVKTELNSIFIISILILLTTFYYTISKKSIDFAKKIKLEWLQLLIGLFVLIILFTLSYYFFYIFIDGAIFGDNQFYASIATNLNKNGVETTNFDWTLVNKQAVPYHYAELWFTAFYAYIFSSPTLSIYYLLYIPVFGSIVFIGSMAMAELIFEKKGVVISSIILVFLGLLFLILQNVDFPFFSNNLLYQYCELGSWFHNIKFSIVYVLLLAACVFFISHEYRLMISFLLLLIPFYSPVSAAILSGLFFLFFYWYIVKLINSKTFFGLTSILVFVFICYTLFYFFQRKDAGDSLVLGNNLNLIKIYLKEFRIYFKLIIFGILPTFICCCLPYYLYNKSIFRSKLSIIINNKCISSILAFLFGGLAILFIIIPLYFLINHDAFQLLGTFISPFFSLIIFFIFIYFFPSKNKRLFLSYLILVFVYFGLLMCQNPSIPFNMKKLSYIEPYIDQDYFDKIKPLIEADPTARFGYFRLYNVEQPMNYKPFLFVPDNRIIHFCPDYIPICLSVYNLPKNVDSRYGNKNDFALYRFVELRKKQNKFTNFEQSVTDFVEMYNLKFIIVEQGAFIPNSIMKKAHYCVSNKVNKNKFLVLQ